jgi:hypothetical protein
VSTSLLAEQTAAVRSLFATVTDTPAEAFLSDELIVASRPEPPAWPFTAMVVGFGAGVVWCLEQRYVDWAKAQAPKPHFAAFYLGFQLALEAQRRGESLHANPPTIGWALAETPAVQPVRDGYRIERVDREWMAQWQPMGVFHNALGTPDQTHRTYRNLFAYAVFDANEEPAAIAGVYDTAGLSEIGVDVRRDHRARGLAAVVVSAAARDILDAGRTPFYECPATNTRSQRTALASGFMPVCSLALTYQAGLGLATRT